MLLLVIITKLKEQITIVKVYYKLTEIFYNRSSHLECHCSHEAALSGNLYSLWKAQVQDTRCFVTHPLVLSFSPGKGYICAHSPLRALPQLRSEHIFIQVHFRIICSLSFYNLVT